MKMTVRVEWYDNFKGIGIAKTTRGKEVFLNSTNIVENFDKVSILNKSDILDCEITEIGGYLIASRIEKIFSH